MPVAQEEISRGYWNYPNMFSPSTSSVTKCQVNTCDQTLTSDHPSDILHSSEQQSEEPRTTGDQKSKASRKARAKLKCMKIKRPMKKYCKKRIATEETNVDLRGVCSKTEKGDEWIYCDMCNIWYHRFCLDLDDEEWTAVSSTSSIYTCPMCL